MLPPKVDEFLREAPQKIHWGDEAERLRTLSTLAELSQLDRNLPRITQEDPLINTLMNGLKTFAVSSLAACIQIISIFERMSYYTRYSEFLTRFKIGATTLNLFHAQVALRNVADQSLSKEKLSGYMASQNHLLRLIISLLFNISENASAMRKMVNKDILTPLCGVLDRRNPDLLILALRFIRKISLVPVNWNAVPYDQIPDLIAKNIFRWGQFSAGEGRRKRVSVVREGLEILYAFSFHPEAVPVIKQDNIFAMISNFVEVPELRPQLIRLFYCVSGGDGSDEVFRRDAVVNMLIMAATNQSDYRVAALVILSKLSLDREISLSVAKSPIFTAENLKGMFVQATSIDSEETRLLLQLIRNIADNQPDLVRGFDDEIVAACLRNRDRPVFVHVMAIANRAKMNSERAKYYIAQTSFLQLLFDTLENDRIEPQLHLECVMFTSALVLYSTAAQVLGKRGIVDVLIKVFTRHANDMDIQSQCMFAFFRLTCHSETRAALLAHREIVGIVLKHSTSKNAVLNGIAHSLLDAMMTFDRQSADKLLMPRFDAFNQEWLSAIAALDQTASE
jgi:hypothetical protein